MNTIMGRLHARQLRLLVALGDHCSLLNAAKEVSMSQPGASKALREIESIFGAELFTRTNRGLEPNAIGDCVIRYARVFQTDMEHLREELVSVMRGTGGRVTAGAIMGAIPLLTTAITSLLMTQSDISVEVVEDTSAALLTLLDGGRIDLALCRTSVSRTPSLYQSDKVQRESLSVVANAEHALVKRKRVQLEELAEARWIVYRANMPIRRLLEREFYDAGLRVPLHLIETTSAFTTMCLLQQNEHFVAMLPTDVADNFTAQGWARTLAVPIGSRSEPYELVTRANAKSSPGASMLITEIRKHAVL
ncbi:LysR family transcriptional regulator [Cupriavidus pinatubonensis]|uniref:LysR family transcriptional regulator n=1 Tax=Cupriavidus pinatubonensis TaxID=248026 RepID=UPI001FD1B26D|nr:LysR family transcriptional regulator [Cupriavidus pinatubonensis]